MTISLYGTTELIQVQQRLADLPDNFFRNLYPRVITSDREEVMFEKADIDNRRLAPFVAPNVQGRVMRGQGYRAESFKPAYVKPKHIVDPTKAIPRMMGEPLLGGQSMAQRFDAHVVNNMRMERISIERRWDWMGAKAAVDGMVTVAGDDYPTRTVDFNRNADLTVQLLTTARWSQTGTATPLDDLANVVDDAFAAGNAPITDLVFGTTAWRNFIKNAAVKDLLSTLSRGSSSVFSVIPLTQNTNYQSAGFIETPGGRFNLWRYSNWYTDVDSLGNYTVQQFLDPTVVFGYGQAMDGAALFGAIHDADADFAAEATIFPKMWKNQDPSVVYTLSQSAPLFVPLNPDNTFKLITE